MNEYALSVMLVGFFSTLIGWLLGYRDGKHDTIKNIRINVLAGTPYLIIKGKFYGICRSQRQIER